MARVAHGYRCEILSAVLVRIVTRHWRHRVTLVKINENALIYIRIASCSTSVECIGPVSGKGTGKDGRSEEMYAMLSMIVFRALLRAAKKAVHQSKSSEDEIRNNFSKGKRVAANYFFVSSTLVELRKSGSLQKFRNVVHAVF